VADPGYHLVRGALAAGIPVVPVPGPSAVVALVSVAGLPAERFVFEGFLPSRAGPRAARLAALAREPRAMVFFEAARRLGAFFEAAERAFGERDAVVGRELTKRYEEILRGTLPTLRAEVAGRVVLRGEVTVLVAGAVPGAAEAEVPGLDDEIRRALAAGRSLRDLSAEIARRHGRPRREVYQRALELAAG
jgi:16S rRNA (cytidine1402-2'-O)-methyltransferase